MGCLNTFISPSNPVRQTNPSIPASPWTRTGGIVVHSRTPRPDGYEKSAFKNQPRQKINFRNDARCFKMEKDVGDISLPTNDKLPITQNLKKMVDEIEKLTETSFPTPSNKTKWLWMLQRHILNPILRIMWRLLKKADD